MSERIDEAGIADLEWSILRGCVRYDGHLWSTAGMTDGGMVTLHRAQWGVTHEIEVPVHDIILEVSKDDKRAKITLQLIEFYRSHNKT